MNNKLSIIFAVTTFFLGLAPRVSARVVSTSYPWSTVVAAAAPASQLVQPAFGFHATADAADNVPAQVDPYFKLAGGPRPNIVIGSVPEPGSLGLLGTFALPLLGFIRRRPRG